jgi:carbamoyl-phosphate synthase large subunit
VKRHVSVLVTAAGTIVAQGIIKSLKLASSQGPSPAYRIVASDITPLAVGLYRSDAGVLVPPAHAPDYVDSIVKVCKKESVVAVFVGSEEELETLSRERERIRKETGAVVISNPPRVISVGRDKWKTFQFLKKNGLPCADSALLSDLESFVRDKGYPIVVKPREGHGSVHFYVAKDGDDVDSARKAIAAAGWRPLLQEYLGGEDTEYTAGVTVDRSGRRVMSSIAMRRTLRNGQTYRGLVDDFPHVRKTAEKVALALGARGALNVQSRLVEGEPKTFEINPRFSASCAMRSVAGVNEPDIVFRNLILGEDVRVRSYRKLVCMRYWNEVYVPPAQVEMMKKGHVDGADSFIPGYF